MFYGAAICCGSGSFLYRRDGYDSRFASGHQTGFIQYCDDVLLFLGVPSAYTLAILKALSVLLMRGAYRCPAEFIGGLVSVTVMLLLLRLEKNGLSYLVISILGAIGHNMGQLFGAAMLTGTALTLYYFPILILSGIGMGFVTGLVLKTVLPALEKLDRRLG